MLLHCHSAPPPPPPASTPPPKHHHHHHHHHKNKLQIFKKFTSYALCPKSGIWQSRYRCDITERSVCPSSSLFANKLHGKCSIVKHSLKLIDKTNFKDARVTNVPGHSISYKIACAVSDQSLRRVLCGSVGGQGFKASRGGQRWLGSVFVDAQADMCLRREHIQSWECCALAQLYIQSTLVISNSKGLTETLRDIRNLDIAELREWEKQ